MKKFKSIFDDWTLEEKKSFVEEEVKARQEYFDEYDKKQEEKKHKALERANKYTKETKKAS
jgi:hypothetical protein